VASLALLVVFLIESLEFKPFLMVDHVESVELLPEFMDFLVESNGLLTDRNELVLELSEFVNKLLEFVSQLSGLALVLGKDLHEVVDHSLVILSLVLELISSIANHVALGKGHLVDLNKHLKLLEVEQEGLVLGLDLPAEFLDFAKVHIGRLVAEVTLELSTDVGDSLTGLGAEGTAVVEALDLGGELVVESGVRLSELGEAFLFGQDASLLGEEVSDDGGLSGELRVSVSDHLILDADLINEVVGKILSHLLDLLNHFLGVIVLSAKECDLNGGGFVLDLE